LASANEHAYPTGGIVPPVEHVSATVPANPPFGVMITVALPGLLAAIGTSGGETTSVKLPVTCCGFVREPATTFFQALARFAAFTVPSPVTKSYPGLAAFPVKNPFVPATVEEHPAEPPAHGTALLPAGTS
jgi:hypothetical protein